MRHTVLRLEFAPRARHVPWPGVAILTASGALLVIAMLMLGERLAANARQQEVLGTLVAHRTANGTAEQPRAADPAEAGRVRALRRVTQNLATPWADMLGSLEAAPQQSAVLLSIEPTASKHAVRITAEARTAQDMLTYLGALQHDARLSEVILVSHQIEERTPGTPLRFQIAATWGVTSP